MLDLRIAPKVIVLAVTAAFNVAAFAGDRELDYRILAASRTSTMEKELNEAAAAGYRFSKAMGGKTANGGPEVVVAMVKEPRTEGQGVRRYRLLATSRTSTLQKELQQSADEGYQYLEQTVFESAFGGKEVVVIMELDPAKGFQRSAYRMLATSRTSTMQKELNELGEQGYVLLGLTVGETAYGGHEVVAILRKN